jgi:hypothetical protein
VTEKLNQQLAHGATAVIEGGFTGVNAVWWWERRMGGGIEVCQELDPERMTRELAAETGREPAEVRRAVNEVLGSDDDEPVVLTFEVPGETTTADAVRILSARSSRPEGLAAGLYDRVRKALAAPTKDD